jgi:PAS domain S-box-containing protein
MKSRRPGVDLGMDFQENDSRPAGTRTSIREIEPAPAARLLLISPDGELVRRLTRQLGAEHEVHVSPSLPEELTSLRPDVLVLDLAIADPPTLERLAALRSSPELRATQVLFLAGDEGAEEIADAAVRSGDGRHRSRLLEPQLLERARELLAEARRRLQGRARELRRSEAHRRALVETTTDAVVTIGVDGRIRSFNPAAETLFGYTEAEMLGEDVGRLMPADEARRHPGHVRAYLETGVRRILSVGREVEAVRNDGTRVPVHLWVNEVRLEDEVLFVGFLRDLSAQKKLREEFLQAQKLESVGRLAGGMAHDFNNLLTGIEGGLRMIEERLGDGHAAAPLVDELRDETRRGASMVRQLLRFSRRTPTRPRGVDPGRVLHDAEPILCRLLGEDVEVRLEVPAELPAVHADPVLLEQALLNLAINARDAMPDGGHLEIRALRVDLSPDGAARLAPGCRPGPHVVIEVRDEGFGMDGETLRRAKEAFFTTKDAGRGTGLGLATVDELMREWGGALELESEPGVGTTVRLHLRVGGEVEDEEEPAGDRHGGVAARLLVVEDEGLVRRALKHVLERAGHRVEAVRDAAEALDALRRAPEAFDLLLTDVVLPGMNGPGLARAAREHAPELATLFMSAYSREDLIESGKLPPEALSIEKPFRDAELLGRIQEALSPR